MHELFADSLLGVLSAGRNYEVHIDDVQPRVSASPHKDWTAHSNVEEVASCAESQDEELSLPHFLPLRVYETATQELSQGGKQTLEKCLSLWRAGRLGPDVLFNFVKSVAWQSSVLTKHFSVAKSKPEPELQELLSFEDLEALKLRGMKKRCRDVDITSAESSTAFERFVLAPPEKRRCTSPVLSAFDRMNAESALEIVESISMMDSSRTTKLGSIIRACPGLAALFTTNGWDTKLKHFTTAPSWEEAKSTLTAAVGEEMCPIGSPRLVQTF
eukprot:9135-Rhodomonas_salina.3